MFCSAGLDPDVYDVINEVIQQKNPYAKAIPRISSLINENTQTYEHVIEPVQRRERQFDLPASIEISGLIPNNTGYMRDVRLKTRVKDAFGNEQEKFQKVNQFSSVYEPLHNVLLFHHGEPGWELEAEHDGHRKSRVQHLTQREHAAYKIQVRDNDIVHFRYFGRFAHEYFVDMFVRMRRKSNRR